MGAFSNDAFSDNSFSVVQSAQSPSPSESNSITSISLRTSPKRKEVSQRVILDDGTAITIKVLDGILIDDLLISGMKAEGYRVMTGIDNFPTIDRTLKDYLIKTGVIQG